MPPSSHSAEAERRAVVAWRTLKIDRAAEADVVTNAAAQGMMTMAPSAGGYSSTAWVEEVDGAALNRLTSVTVNQVDRGARVAASVLGTAPATRSERGPVRNVEVSVVFHVDVDRADDAEATFLIRPEATREGVDVTMAWRELVGESSVVERAEHLLDAMASPSTATPDQAEEPSSSSASPASPSASTPASA